MSELQAPTMDWSRTDRVATYKLFKQKAKMYFDAKDIKKGKQVSFILLMTGDEGVKMFNSWEMSPDDSRDPEAVWEHFDKHIEPQSSFRVERLAFQHMKQHEQESSDDFVSRLKNQADLCRFMNKGERILDQIIFGTKYAEVQKTLLVKDENCTLTEAAELARIHDAAVAQQQAFKEIQGQEQHDFQVNSLHKSSSCTRCGKKQHTSFTCPAIGTFCNKCGGPDHWEKACRSKPKPPAQNYGNNSSKYPRTYRSRSHGRARGNKSRGSNRRSNQRDNYQDYQEVDTICHEDNADDSFWQIEYHVVNITVDTVKKNDDSAYVTLNIQVPSRPVSDTLKLKVDTGAGGNILPLRVYRQMFPENIGTNGCPVSQNVLCRPEIKLTAYNGSVIKQYGATVLDCQFKDSEWKKLVFYIAESDGPAILGLPSCRSLKVVSLHCDDVRLDVPKNGNRCMVNSLEDLKESFPECFDTLGNFPGEYHITVDPNIPPVVHAPRKYPIQRREQIREEIDKMEAMGVIIRETEPTDWVSSLTFTEKQDGSLRVCLDPKDLNQAIKRSHHKIPTLEEISHHFSGAICFSKMDAKNGYWSIKLDAPSSKLTTFNTPFGRFRFLRLPFGLVVSQDVFQQRMDAILEQCPGCVGIADDVAVMGTSEEEHDRSLLNLMKVAVQQGLVFNSSKCIIKTAEIPFFGMVYSASGIKPDPQRVEAIRQLPPPENVKEVQEFLGIATYMTAFIPKLAHHSAVLRELLRNNIRFTWTDTHNEAFGTIKELICQSTVLSYFDPAKDSVLEVDSSKRGLGAVLMQDGRPIAFASKSLTETESRYANIERELLAVVYGCERFHTYLYGKPFVVHSDHKPLQMIQLKNLHAAPPRLQRMLLRLQNYNINIVYRPGKTLLLADGLSRLNSTRASETIELDVQVNLVQFSNDRIQQLRMETACDPVLAPLKDIILNGWPDNLRQVPKDLRLYWSYRDELSVEDGVILKGSEQVLVPETMQRQILEALHMGHQGRDKCRLRAKASVYWNNINKDIETFVASCNVCQEHARSQQKEPLLQKDIPPYPWHTVHADLFELEGDEYLLVVDSYSKYPFVRRMGKSCSSKACIEYLKELFGTQGVPELMYTDNGPQFSCLSFQKFSQDWSFRHVTSSPTYAQSNGFAERAVQTVKNTMKKAKQDDMDTEFALLCLRTTPISDRVMSPMELLMGRKAKANLPLSTRNNHPDRELIYAELEKRQTSQKAYYDMKAGPELSDLQSGQGVRVQQHKDSRWVPATVVRRCSEPRSYIVEMENGGQLRRNRHQIREVQKCSRYGRLYKAVQ